MNAPERIFVQIASYRDSECQHTVRDLFEKAANPNRIYVGICWQFDRKEDQHCFEVPYPRPKQVRVKEFDYRDSKGAGWARHEAQSLCEGEEYTLQLDAHHRFVPGWDEKLIRMLKECPTEKAVLTSLLPNYSPPDELQDTTGYLAWQAIKEVGEGGLPQAHLKGILRKVEEAGGKPILGAFMVGNFFFLRTKDYEKFPFDPYIYFLGDEMTQSARLWTHGYDIYQPYETVCYHQWLRQKAGNQGYKKKDDPRNQLSYERVRHVLGIAKSNNPAALREIEKYGAMGTERSLSDFWKFTGVDFINRTVEEKAQKGRWEPWDSGKKASAKKDTSSRIFVQIASYRDPECQHTVKDLFDKAANPERVFVGICWQYDPEKDTDCFLVEPSRPEQVRVDPWHWQEGKGVCWARSQTQSLWEGEEYTLQIDSHMRFVPGWDQLMIGELEATGNPKAILSCYPAAYTPPDQLEPNPKPAVMRAKAFDAHGNIRGAGAVIDRAPEKPLHGAFIAAGFMFSRGDVIKEVPYDPHLYFSQEEFSLAARFYTHGWDIYHPTQCLIYHYYHDKGRPKHWGDIKDEFQKTEDRSRQRFHYLMAGKEPKDPEAIVEIEKYGMGSARTLKQFEEFTGIDFKNRKASEKAMRALFIEGLEKVKDRPVYVPELDDGKPAPASTPAPAAQPQPAADKVVPISAKAASYDPNLRIYASTVGVGDFVPLFELPDQNGNIREMQACAGSQAVVFFLPPDEVYIKAFHDALMQSNAAYHRVCVVPMGPAQTKKLEEKLGLRIALWSDEDYAVHKAFGAEGNAPTSFLLNRNLKITRAYRPQDPSKHIKELAEDVKSLQSTAPGPIITMQAPIMLVPNALNDEMCARIIAYWETGKQYTGSLGVGKESKVDSKVKSRTDTDIHDKTLHDAIDESLAKSLFPELRKAYDFEPRYHDIYKVGCYFAEQKGHYAAHRDTSIPAVAHRRYSMSLCLNSEYEGGCLVFPEYGDFQYRLEKGTAAIFPSTLFHYVTPVTKGKRYVLVTFCNGEAEEKFRLQNAAERGEQATSVFKFNPYTAKFKDIRESRIYTQSIPVSAPATSVPDLLTRSELPYDRQLLNNGQVRQLQVRKGTPEGVMIIENYLEKEICEQLTKYADAQTFQALKVIDYASSTKDAVVTKPSTGRVTDHVNIDGMAGDILSIFNDVYCNRLAPFYNVNFEWYERPQILRYPPGGKYDRHADADHWLPEKKEWARSQDRDYSVLLYLNDDYEGGELEFPTQKYKFKPQRGMLVAFPSDHKYLHAALPTTSGIRYVIVSWAAVLGTKRVREKPPYASVFVRQKREKA